MTMYQKIAEYGPRLFGHARLLKTLFNVSPMYRRSTGRLVEVSDDLMTIRVRLPISYRNRNYVGAIYGGSMFSAIDGVPMVQLMNLIGDDYVVWDKSAGIVFKRPAREDLYATIAFTDAELADIKRQVAEQGEMTFEKRVPWQDRAGEHTYSEVRKELYVADKAFFRQKQQAKGRL